MTTEKLVRVLSLDELRVGMIVVIYPCGRGCGRRHRGILTVFLRGHHWASMPSGKRTGAADVWRLEPNPVGGAHGSGLVIGEASVRKGILFRVVDPTLENERMTPEAAARR